MASKNKIGIIAEDQSDVDSVVVLLRRISRKKFETKPHIGHGTGKIIRKCNSWADTLRVKGCKALIIVHDSDGKKVDDIKSRILDALRPCPISNFSIVIPVQEIEAWILSDPGALKTALKLRSIPKNSKGLPEDVPSPKEYVESIVARTDSTKKYNNVVHNKHIFEKVSLSLLEAKCPSFLELKHFASKNLL